MAELLTIQRETWRVIFLIKASKFGLLRLLLFSFWLRLQNVHIFLVLLFDFFFRSIDWVLLNRENILRYILKWFSTVHNVIMISNLKLFSNRLLNIFLYFEHHFISARFTSFIIFTFITLTKICAINSRLEALTIFFLTERFLTIASFEMPFFFIANS